MYGYFFEIQITCYLGYASRSGRTQVQANTHTSCANVCYRFLTKDVFVGLELIKKMTLAPTS